MTMYDVLMQLPVFLGISSTQFTEILEKIPFQFEQYENNEVILRSGELCENVTFVLSGTVRMTTPTFGERVHVIQDFQAPYTLPFYNLFGANTLLHDTVVSMGHTGIMRLDKQNFLRVLQQNKILLVNVLNMLSTHAQKQHKAMDFSGESDPVLRLSSWMLALTERAATGITMRATAEDWCSMLQLDEQSFWRCVATLEGQKVVESERGSLKLLDRYGLRTFVGQKTAQKN